MNKEAKSIGQKAAEAQFLKEYRTLAHRYERLEKEYSKLIRKVKKIEYRVGCLEEDSEWK